MRDWIDLVESAGHESVSEAPGDGFRRIPFDDLPEEVQADICGNLEERNPFFVENRYDAADARANLSGLIQPPEVLVGRANVKNLLGAPKPPNKEPQPMTPDTLARLTAARATAALAAVAAAERKAERARKEAARATAAAIRAAEAAAFTAARRATKAKKRAADIAFLLHSAA